MESAKLIIEVMAGVVPGKPLDEYTKRWAYTSAQWDLLNNEAELQKSIGSRSEEWHQAKALWVRVHGESREYEASLENPSQFNWVRRDWVWL